jgi:uncharacterized membrane protein
MGLFLLSSPGRGLIEAFLWVIAPLITGLGFAIGVVLFNRIIKYEGESFHRILIWPLIGCFLGAISVYWFGPMLIVFSMLSFGTLSIVIREFFLRQLGTE